MRFPGQFLASDRRHLYHARILPILLVRVMVRAVHLRSYLASLVLLPSFIIHKQAPGTRALTLTLYKDKNNSIDTICKRPKSHGLRCIGIFQYHRPASISSYTTLTLCTKVAWRFR